MNICEIILKEFLSVGIHGSYEFFYDPVSFVVRYLAGSDLMMSSASVFKHEGT